MTKGKTAIVATTAILYFSEGFPYGVVNEFFPLYLRANGVSLSQIGLLSLVSLAWTVKLFWAPLVDTLGTYKHWIFGSLGVMLAGWLGLVVGVQPGSPVFWFVVTMIALASATQDIAVDALTITMTPSGFLGSVNSTRVTAYRIAIILAGGGLAWVASLSGWRAGFAVAAGTTIAIMIACTFVSSPPREKAETAKLVAGIRVWLARPQSGAALAVVLLYRLGDSALAPMLKPFWVDRGYSPAEIGTITTVAGISFTIAGAIAGGAFVERFGLGRGLLWLGIAQLLSNGGYASIASFGGGRPAMYSAAFIENFTGGLGLAAFLSLLMSLCDRRHAATEYALLSALFGLTRSISGSVSGVAADYLGYANYFWITVALGLPGLLFLPSIRGAWMSTDSGIPPETAA